MNNTTCSCCAVAPFCESKNGTGCGSQYAVPLCKHCKNCEIVEVYTEQLYFCVYEQPKVTAPEGYCIHGEQGSPKLIKALSLTFPPEDKQLNDEPGSKKQPTEVNIYTDGACKGNPGPGGWGAIIVCGDNEKELGGGENPTTNNRMELTGVIEALQVLKRPCKVTLTTDSKYVVDALTKGWATNWKKNGWKKSDGKEALNVDLWEKLLTLLEKHEVSFVWVKGHAGHPFNERCDKIASSYANKERKT